MTFKEKIKLIEHARKSFPTFEYEFREYLAQGHSFNGAYNYFSVEEVNKHEALSKKAAELEAWKTSHGSVVDASPVPLTDSSIIQKLEELNDSVDKSNRTKELPKHKAK